MEIARAMELLGLTNLELDLSQLEAKARKARKRWHPDGVSWRNDPAEIARYTLNFQSIDEAVAALRAYLAGETPGHRSSPRADQATSGDTADILRAEAPRMQGVVAAMWAELRRTGALRQTERVVVAEGRRLGDLLQADFKDDVATASIVSLFYGTLPFGFLTAFATGLHPALGVLAGLVWLAQALSCVVGMLPLARLWVPERPLSVVGWFVDFGFGVFRWCWRKVQGDPWWAQLFVVLPNLLALVIRYALLLPLVTLARAVAGDRLVGHVEKDAEFHAGLADWYIEQLLAKPPSQITEEELFHLSHLYSEAIGYQERAK